MSWSPTLHPFYKLPTREQALALSATEEGAGRLRKLLLDREKAIQNAKLDPYKHGCVLEHWKDAEAMLEAHSRLLISGGNRSGKTQFAARRIVRRMVKTDGARVACFSMTAASSVRDQQPAVYNYLPREWKTVKKSKTADVTYSQKNGFTENTFIAPNGSQCFFFHYSQQSDILEGAEFDEIWFDELVPYSWVQTAAYRLVTRKGKMLITATPITGWTPVVNEFVTNCRVTESRVAPLLDKHIVHVKGCPPGHMPYKATCLREDSAVLFFFTEMNPFQPQEEMARVVSGETLAQKRIRGYGWTEKGQAGYFGKFSGVHVVPDAEVQKEGTNYMVTDPAGSRMWFGLWLRVCKDGTHYVYREFPSLGEYGEWATLGEKSEGEIGEAARPQGWGLTDYKAKFIELEKGEDISERLIDPRAGGTPMQTQDGGDTLIDLLSYEPHSMGFSAASGVHIEQGISAINDLLSYNLEEPLSTVNKPQLFITESCGNLIRSMQNVTPAGGDKNKWKDPVDCLRYLIIHGCTYVDPAQKPPKGGSY